MTDFKPCEVCGSTDIDDYGCIDCMLDFALEELYKGEEDADIN